MSTGRPCFSGLVLPTPGFLTSQNHKACSACRMSMFNPSLTRPVMDTSRRRAGKELCPKVLERRRRSSQAKERALGYLAGFHIRQPPHQCPRRFAVTWASLPKLADTSWGTNSLAALGSLFQTLQSRMQCCGGKTDRECDVAFPSRAPTYLGYGDAAFLGQLFFGFFAGIRITKVRVKILIQDFCGLLTEVTPFPPAKRGEQKRIIYVFPTFYNGQGPS